MKFVETDPDYFMRSADIPVTAYCFTTDSRRESDYDLVILWCREQFGPANYYKDANLLRWSRFGWYIRFASHVDAMAFKMRWG